MGSSDSKENINVRSSSYWIACTTGECDRCRAEMRIGRKVNLETPCRIDLRHQMTVSECRMIVEGETAAMTGNERFERRAEISLPTESCCAISRIARRAG